jgi:hypothetical protein
MRGEANRKVITVEVARIARKTNETRMWALEQKHPRT